MYKAKKLPFLYYQLEPTISAKTNAYHYEKHYKTYLNNPNKIIVKNNISINYELYFESIKEEKKLPDSNLLLAINNSFGNLDNMYNEIKNTGKYLVEGLWDGLLSKANWLYNQVKSFAKNIIGNIKSALGIHSPSTVMRDEVGKYLAQGLGVGFDKELDSVYNDMQRAIDIETSKMSANVQTSGTYQMAMAGTPTFNLVDNASNTTQLVVNGKVLAEVVNTENRNREVATS